MPIRVLHFQKVTGVGGSERHLLSLLPGLSKAGIDIRLCVLRAGDAERFIGLAETAGIDTAVLPAGSDIDITMIKDLGHQIDSFHPDVVHTHLIHADAYAQEAARRRSIAAVSTVHSTHSFYLRWPYRSVMRRSWSLARRVIAISRHVEDFLVTNRLVSPERVTVIPYGIAPFSDSDVLEKDVSQLHRTLQAAPGDVIIGMAARMIPGKGHELLLEAFDRVAKTHPQLRLVFAGDGPLHPRLTHVAQGLASGPRVRFIGYVDNVWTLMSACDIVVFPTDPTLREGFGLAALEAMVVGRPVVATDVGALPELIADGVTGFVVPADDPERLADAIITLALDESLRRDLGRAGVARAHELFSLDSMIEQTVRVYRGVAPA